jgi:competence protein ComGC
MKKMILKNKWAIMIALLLTLMIISLILLISETNFASAIAKASLVKGGDSEIESVMESYGFYLNEWRGYTPSLAQKLQALIN